MSKPTRRHRLVLLLPFLACLACPAHLLAFGALLGLAGGGAAAAHQEHSETWGLIAIVAVASLVLFVGLERRHHRHHHCDHEHNPLPKVCSCCREHRHAFCGLVDCACPYCSMPDEIVFPKHVEGCGTFVRGCMPGCSSYDPSYDAPAKLGYNCDWCRDGSKLSLWPNCPKCGTTLEP